jgi:hypothetical protein
VSVYGHNRTYPNLLLLNGVRDAVATRYVNTQHLVDANARKHRLVNVAGTLEEGPVVDLPLERPPASRFPQPIRVDIHDPGLALMLVIDRGLRRGNVFIGSDHFHDQPAIASTNAQDNKIAGLHSVAEVIEGVDPVLNIRRPASGMSGVCLVPPPNGFRNLSTTTE